MSATIRSRFRVLLAEKETREQRRISLRSIVRETGVSISTVEGLANNTLREFPAAGLAAICRYLGCTVGDLLVLADEEPVDHTAEQRSVLGMAH